MTSLESRTTTEVGSPLLVVPLGSTEQHGPHLPLSTDTEIASAVAAALVERIDGSCATPPVWVSASGEHDGFPGTLSIGTRVLVDLVVELVRSADWAAGVVAVNAHGGNAEALSTARQVLAEESRRFLVVSCDAPGDAHAGATETSLMLHLRPELVRAERVEAGCMRPWQEIREEVRSRGVRAVAPNGVLGDPSSASAQRGAVLFADMVDRAYRSVDAWLAGP